MFTNFSHGVASMGIPALGSGIPPTNGRYIFVDYVYGADGNDGLSLDTPVKTFAQANSLTKNNDDDVIVLDTRATHVITSMVTISNSRVNVVSMDFSGRKYGLSAKISVPTGTATDTAMITNLGSRNSFTGVKFSCDNANATCLATFAEGGEYTAFNNCEFYHSTLLGTTGACEVMLNGDSTQFYNCTFGSLADLITGNYIRAAVNLTGGSVVGALSGGVSRDLLFENCKFWKNAGGTTTAMIYISASNDLERFMELRDCTFAANILGSTPAVAVASAASLTKAYVLATGSTASVNCTKLGTFTGFYSALPARVATATIGIQGT